MIITKSINVKTKGNTDVINITSLAQNIIEKNSINEGSALIFIKGSTAGLTTIEYEPGLIKDIKEFFEKIIPENKNYFHNEKWHDYNGHSHLRSSLLKTSLTIPFKDKQLLLGTWQQIVLIDVKNLWFLNTLKICNQCVYVKANLDVLIIVKEKEKLLFSLKANNFYFSFFQTF